MRSISKTAAMLKIEQTALDWLELNLTGFQIPLSVAFPQRRLCESA
ncbi:hypothetical protein [Acinetobacter sp.]